MLIMPVRVSVVFMLALVAVSKARETLLLSPLSFRPAELTDDTIVKRSASYFSGVSERNHGD